ncbi:MAG TPA: 3-oxoacyl-ACP reductase family protein [Acidobacteriaceae bacterium]|nr:3-oxoacyl-ACP reductase family protein [Acidobacteriaceae bacterium]
MNSLEGKVALVTGASRGIGRAIAVDLAKAGADVVLNFLNRSREAEAVEMEIRKMGRRCARVQAHVSVAKDVERLAHEAQERVGSVDILVNNAGIARPQALEEISESDWDELIDTNLKSCFLVTQAFLPAMRARKWGRIINISSVAAQIGGVVGPHYAASKAGMLGLTYYYARHLAQEGITANAIAPALIETDMVRANLRAAASNVPVGRFGAVEEVADVAVMLAKNGYITGQTINVNGGWVTS